jgi:hypothetical protein
MAPTFSTRIFVPDPDFLPTQEQLLAVPDALESVGGWRTRRFNSNQIDRIWQNTIFSFFSI